MQGVTLVELLTVVAIIAVAITLAAPSFSQVSASNSSRRIAFDLYTALVLARSEAIKRNLSVTIEPADDDWAAGWMICPTAGCAMVGGQEAPIATFGGVKGISVEGPESIQFGRSGRASWDGDDALFVIKPTADSSLDERCVGLDPSGRPYLEKKPSCSS
jgi:type IV fimbrial biogenesis protein FimT